MHYDETQAAAVDELQVLPWPAPLSPSHSVSGVSQARLSPDGPVRTRTAAPRPAQAPYESLNTGLH